jgi:uncharacterized protein (DUF697 family)
MTGLLLRQCGFARPFDLRQCLIDGVVYAVAIRFRALQLERIEVAAHLFGSELNASMQARDTFAIGEIQVAIFDRDRRSAQSSDVRIGALRGQYKRSHYNNHEVACSGPQRNSTHIKVLTI